MAEKPTITLQKGGTKIPCVARTSSHKLRRELRRIANETTALQTKAAANMPEGIATGDVSAIKEFVKEKGEEGLDALIENNMEIQDAAEVVTLKMCQAIIHVEKVDEKVRDLVREPVVDEAGVVSEFWEDQDLAEVEAFVVAFQSGR